MPLAAVTAPVASALSPLIVVKQFGTLVAPWFPPERSIRCGCIESRVFLDVKDVLEIAIPSLSARKALYLAWFSKDNVDSTHARFCVDKTHWRHVQWGNMREGGHRFNVAGSLYLLLPILRAVNDDASKKLADEIESRVGMGLDLAVHGKADAETPPTTTVPDPSPLAGEVAEMKQTLTSISNRIHRFETHVFSDDTGDTTTSRISGIGPKRPRESSGDEERCTRARYEAELARANFERDYPDQAYASKFRVIREQIVLAISDGNTQLRDTLVAKLSDIVTSL